MGWPCKHMHIDCEDDNSQYVKVQCCLRLTASLPPFDDQNWTKVQHEVTER